MSGYDLEKDQDREDRRKHLELVSAVVARMASASAAAKGWSITVAGAAFGIAVVRSNWFVFLLGVIALVVFGIVDGLYLHSERKFRDLYDAIIAENSTVRPLSMDPSGFVARRRRESLRSWSVLGFYVPLAAVGLVLMVISMSIGDQSSGAITNEPAGVPAVAPSPTSSAAIPSTPSVQESTQSPTTASAPPEVVSPDLSAAPYVPASP